jgi:hypothetical protein
MLGLDQPKISALTRGKLAGFTLERLLRFLNDLNYNVEIKLTPRARGTPASRPEVRLAEFQCNGSHPPLLDGVRITGRQSTLQLSKTYAISGNSLVARPLQNTPRQRGWRGRRPEPRTRRITGDFQ